MNPEPYPTLLEQAAELDVASKFAEGRGDQLHAEYLANEARTLREQAAAVEARNASS